MWKRSGAAGEWTSRGDDFALSLLSVWGGLDEKHLPWQDCPIESVWETAEFQAGLDRHLSTRLIGIPHISKGTPKDKEMAKEKGEKGEESQANLTARLMGAILEIESSVSSRIISKAICRLSPDVLLPICYSGPISRSDFPLLSIHTNILGVSWIHFGPTKVTPGIERHSSPHSSW